MISDSMGVKKRMKYLNFEYIHGHCSCMYLNKIMCVLSLKKTISPPNKNFINQTEKSLYSLPGKQRMVQISELQLEISRFSEKLVKMRQRVQSCIQLSTNLEKRAAVRRCLDQVTESSPRLIQVIKSLTGTSKFQAVEMLNVVYLYLYVYIWMKLKILLKINVKLCVCNYMYLYI